VFGAQNLVTWMSCLLQEDAVAIWSPSKLEVSAVCRDIADMLLKYIPAAGPRCRLLTAVGMTGQMRKVERGRRRSMSVTGQMRARTELSRVVQKIVWEHSVLLRMSRILLCHGEAASWVGLARKIGAARACHQGRHLRASGDDFSSGTIQTGAKYGRGRAL
jgi:alkylhydroperoxidase family enzyme